MAFGKLQVIFCSFIWSWFFLFFIVIVQSAPRHAHYQTGNTPLTLVWKDENCSQYVIDTDNKGQVPSQQQVHHSVPFHYIPFDFESCYKSSMSLIRLHKGAVKRIKPLKDLTPKATKENCVLSFFCRAIEVLANNLSLVEAWIGKWFGIFRYYERVS